jgi:hypothetical protein
MDLSHFPTSSGASFPEGLSHFIRRFNYPENLMDCMNLIYAAILGGL